MTTELSLWIDEDRETSTKVAAAALVDTTRYEGHSSISEPIKHQLPSGLVLTVNCEKVPTGNYHIGIEYDGELRMMVVLNSDRFALRVFPPDHSSFVVDLWPPENLQHEC